MAYCPRCGVELEKHISNCPLCDFLVPDIGDEESSGYEETTKKYPNAINISRKDNMIIKNKIFFSFIVVVISVIVILAVLKIIYPSSVVFANYTLITFIAVLFYLFSSFGYLKPFMNVLGLAGTTLFLTYSIDYQTGHIDWFVHYAFPITLILFFDILLFMILFKLSRNRNKFVYVPTCALLFLILVCIGVDGVISYNLRGNIDLSWSLIVLISGSAIAGILLGVYHGIPEKSKTWLKEEASCLT